MRVGVRLRKELRLVNDFLYPIVRIEVVNESTNLSENRFAIRYQKIEQLLVFLRIVACPLPYVIFLFFFISQEQELLVNQDPRFRGLWVALLLDQPRNVALAEGESVLDQLLAEEAGHLTMVERLLMLVKLAQHGAEL